MIWSSPRGRAVAKTTANHHTTRWRDSQQSKASIVTISPFFDTLLPSSFEVGSSVISARVGVFAFISGGGGRRSAPGIDKAGMGSAAVSLSSSPSSLCDDTDRSESLLLERLAPAFGLLRWHDTDDGATHRYCSWHNSISAIRTQKMNDVDFGIHRRQRRTWALW